MHRFYIKGKDIYQYWSFLTGGTSRHILGDCDVCLLELTRSSGDSPCKWFGKSLFRLMSSMATVGLSW